jgi:hypothetical protein
MLPVIAPQPTVSHYLKQGQATVTPVISTPPLQQLQPQAAYASTPATQQQAAQGSTRPVGYLDFSDIPGFGEAAPDSQAFVNSCLQFARTSILSQQANIVDAPPSRQGRDQQRGQHPGMATVAAVPEGASQGTSAALSQHAGVSNTGGVSSTATSSTNTASTRGKGKGLTRTERSTYKAALDAIKHSAAFAGVADRQSATQQALPGTIAPVITTTSTATAAIAATPSVALAGHKAAGEMVHSDRAAVVSFQRLFTVGISLPVAGR